MSAGRHERGDEQRGTVSALRGGDGTISYRRFDFDGAAWPARFIVLDLPPGTSEGVHRHDEDDENGNGAYDEFYYVIAGHGVMTLDGERIEVNAGDCVHAPLGVGRGIANADEHACLRVHITFVAR